MKRTVKFNEGLDLLGTSEEGNPSSSSVAGPAAADRVSIAVARVVPLTEILAQLPKIPKYKSATNFFTSSMLDQENVSIISRPEDFRYHFAYNVLPPTLSEQTLSAQNTPAQSAAVSRKASQEDLVYPLAAPAISELPSLESDKDPRKKQVGEEPLAPLPTEGLPFVFEQPQAKPHALKSLFF